jgi:hypothetical protein
MDSTLWTIGGPHSPRDRRFAKRCTGSRCGEPIEIPADAVGPHRTDPWNVVGCDECVLTFDFDDAQAPFAEDNPGAP